MGLLIIVNILGRKWICIYNYSTIILIAARGISVFTLLYLFSSDPKSYEGLIDNTSWQTQLLNRTYIPAALICIVEFRIYLFYMLPLGIALQSGLTFWTDTIYNSSDCGKFKEGYSLHGTILRDLFFLLIVSLGFYSHSQTLVTRFINNEKSQLQQKQLT